MNQENARSKVWEKRSQMNFWIKMNLRPVFYLNCNPMNIFRDLLNIHTILNYLNNHRSSEILIHTYVQKMSQQLHEIFYCKLVKPKEPI
jgi:hypothetical protein